MNFIEEARGYNYQRDKEEQEQSEEEEEGNIGGEEEEEEAAAAGTATNNTCKLIPFPSTSSSSNSPPFFYQNFLPHHSQELHPTPPLPPPTGAVNFDKKLGIMDLSLGNNNDNIIAGEAVEGSSNKMSAMPIEKEHMFDKVVTPSDVGKLNRLVIPKQQAEKYFPLGSSNDKGLLLNFEDSNGKPWRFRYSYWNSSQSYVMTKGWSRFVKEKKLDAGDIVSFQRGVGEAGRHRLFIDWRRRPSAKPHPDFASHLEFQNQLNFRWGNRWLYSLPHMQNFPPPPPPLQFQYSLNSYNVHQVQTYSPHYQLYERGNVAPFYVRPGVGSQNIGEGIMVGGGGSDDVAPMVIDSVPVVQGRTVGKRLRLFGVNMDCPMVPQSSNVGGDEEESNLVGRPAHGLISAHLGSSTNNSFASYNHVPPAAASSLQFRLPSGSGSSSGRGVPMATMQSHELSKKGKTSLFFDLDL